MKINRKMPARGRFSFLIEIHTHRNDKDTKAQYR